MKVILSQKSVIHLKGDGLYYAGIWQEMVVLESPELMDWVEKIIR